MAHPRKPKALKVLSGSRQPDVDPVDLPLVDEIPDPPEWLPNRYAEKEWVRLSRILHANGLLTEGGLMPLATLCALHGKIAQLWMAGETPTGHLIAQYRALVNDFGLTPVAQTKAGGAGTQVKSGNAFASNNRRNVS